MRHAGVSKVKLVEEQAGLHPRPADCYKRFAQGSHPPVAKASIRAINFNRKEFACETKRFENGGELLSDMDKVSSVRRPPPRVLPWPVARASLGGRRERREDGRAGDGSRPARRPGNTEQGCFPAPPCTPRLCPASLRAAPSVSACARKTRMRARAHDAHLSRLLLHLCVGKSPIW